MRSPPSASVETSQVTNSDESEELPSPTENLELVSPQTEEIKFDVPHESKHHPSSRCSSRYSHRASHPVPKPLTLQGEKIVDADYPQTATRTLLSTVGPCQRRGSLKGQPLIIELFEESTVETQNPHVKPEIICPTKPSTLKFKKQRPGFLKSVKQKKTIVANKPKPPPQPPTAVIGKIEMKCQSTNTDTKEEEQQKNENMIVVGGTDWMMTVKPQAINCQESVLSHLFESATVDDEDLPSCNSPTDQLAASQTTLMTSFGDLKRRNSSESNLAIEISPVLTQLIEHPIEPTSENTLSVPKSTELTLINSDIRTVYEIVKDSVRKDTSLRSLSLQSNEQDSAQQIKPSLPSSTNTSSQNKTLPFETSLSVTQTYNTSDTGLSMRPPLRVVTDSLNSRGKNLIRFFYLNKFGFFFSR